MKTNFLLFTAVTCLLHTAVSIVQHRNDNPLNFKNPSAEDDLTPLTVHLIPHTHNDLGWRKTIDEYYYNGNKAVSQENVQFILDTITQVLQENSTKRFVYVEIGFFTRWWNQQNNVTQDKFKTFVKNEQLEFVSGGYVMNDEAACYYEDAIEQMYLGHQFLLKNFNVTPRVGWQLDPFGHAAAQPALFAQMGFNGLFFGRVDYQDKIVRLQNRTLEMVWVPKTSQGIENAMFSHVMYYLYANPIGFCFDFICDGDPIMDDLRLQDYNVDERANNFTNWWFRGMQTNYLTTTMMHAAGDDFAYGSARMVFKNYDKLLGYINTHYSDYNITFKYSTPSKYLDAIFPLNITYPTKDDDFFPYADDVDSYWAGYFTSRVAFKGLVRSQGAFLQATRRLFTQTLWQDTSLLVKTNFNNISDAFFQLEEALAIGQHHDAITGTARQKVDEDYKRNFGIGEDAVKREFLYPLMKERAQRDLNLTGLEFSTCQLNTSASFCNATNISLKQNTSVLLAIYNSGALRNSTIQVKVPNSYVAVQSYNGTNITADVICANTTDLSDCDLFFTDALSGFNVTYYYLLPVNTSNLVSPQQLQLNSPYVINSHQNITALNLSSFALTSCADSAPTNCSTPQFTIAYNYYESYQDASQQTSGAYIFRPSNSTKFAPLSYSVPTSAVMYRGAGLLQITLTSPHVTAHLRIYNTLDAGVDLHTFVDSIPINDGQGKEVVLVVQVPTINSSNTFYTDSMGLELQTRVLNYRPTWQLNVTQPVAGNYYPVQAAIMIKDDITKMSLTIVPDRAEGGSSLMSGEVEMMIHRRLIVDDDRGVREPLNETDSDGEGMRQWIKHTLVFNIPGYLDTSYREVQLNRDVTNIITLAPNKTSASMITTSINPTSADDFGDFDPMIKLTTRPLALNSFLLRFHNLDDAATRAVSTNVFNSTALGTPTVVETSLTANQNKIDMIRNRMNWNGLGLNNPDFAKNDYLTQSLFVLRALEMRTFVVTFNTSKDENKEMNFDTEYAEIITI